MDRSNWYFRQRVTNPEMNEFQDNAEQADRTETKELIGTGLVTGGSVIENSPVDNQRVLVGVTNARDLFGRRVNIQDQFNDTIASVVRGLTLQLDGIAVPSTVGTYIMFDSEPSVAPFTLVGQTINISRSQFPGNNGAFTIQQVVTTTWGGLVSSQVMVRIDEELDADGYTSGLSPRGTTSISRIATSAALDAVVAFDEGNVDVRPVNPGNERIVSLYARFSRDEFDSRLDGNAQPVDYQSIESFLFVVDASEPEDTIGSANTPALRTNGDVFLADVRLENGANVLNADIDTSRQVFMHTVFGAANRVFQYANLKFFGTKITWNGTNLSTTDPIEISLPDNGTLFTLAAFDEAIADNEVIYTILNPATPGAVTPVVVARGAVPQPGANQIIIELAARRGSKVQGPVVGGELESGQTSDIGDSLADAVFTFIGSLGETDSDPAYTSTAVISQGSSLTAAISALDLALGGSVVQDRLLKLIKGGAYNWNLLGTTADEVQRLVYSAVPDAGSFTLSHAGNVTAAIPFGAAAIDIQNALNALASLSAVTVVGDVSSGQSDITYAAADGAQDQPLLVAVSSLTETINAVTVTVSTLTNGGSNLGALSFTASAFVQVGGLQDARNEIPIGQSPITLPADGDVAYVTINRDPGVDATLAVSVAKISEVPTGLNTVIIARRVGDDVLVGSASFALKDGAYLELDGSKAEIDRLLGQLKITASTVIDRAAISGADRTLLDSAILGQELTNLFMDFGGAVIDFTTGEVFESDGTTPLGQDFTPFAVPVGEFFWYGIAAIPSTVGALNDIAAQMFVTPAASANAVQASAPFPAIAGNKKLGAVQVRNNGGSIEVVQIRRLGVGAGGGGGAGDANSLIETIDDLLNDSTYRLADTNVFSQDADAKVDTATGVFNVADEVYDLDSGQNIVSDNSLDSSEFLGKEEDVEKALLTAFWESGSIDDAATYEISRDGGNNYQQIANMERNGDSTGQFVGEHEFEPEATEQVLDDYAVGNEDATREFLDTGAGIARGQEFVLGSQATLAEVSLYLSKVGSPSGKYFIKIVGDDGGVPSTNPLAVLAQSGAIDMSALVGTLPQKQTLDLGTGLTLDAGTYHIVVDTNQDYKDSFVTATTTIRLHVDASSPTPPDVSAFNGSNWAAVAGEAAVYEVQDKTLVYQTVNEYAVGNADGVLAINDTTTQERGQIFTLAANNVLQQVTLYLNKLGSPLGTAILEVRKDDGGSPSTASDAVLAEASFDVATELSAGNNAITLAIGNLVKAPGDYHLVLRTDQAYKDNFSAGVDEIRVRSDDSSPGITDSQSYNGTVWAAVAGSAWVYLIEGRTLDLRVRITAGTNGSKLAGYGLLYSKEVGETIFASKNQARFTFSGDDDETVFPLGFNPSWDGLKGYEEGTGQVYIPGVAFTLQGQNAIFPAGTFDKPGETITLNFKQNEFGEFDNSKDNGRILTEQHFASLDPAIDRGVAGRGHLHRRGGDGLAVETTVNEFNELEVYEVTP